jgi:hypothetical protein
MKKIAFVLAVVIVTSVFLPLTASAGKPLDEILDYTITVDVQNDGTMNIKYHIEWKVLDSTSEGPLEWIKVGIPNKHVDNIKALSDNIKKIKYYSDDGDFIRIDFKEKYKANTVLNIDFSIHQSYMYTIDNGAARVKYNFTPGWFNDINVNSIKILWKNNKVESSDSETTEGDYLVWNGSLKAGERKTINVSYKKDALNVNEGMQFYGSSTSSESGVIFAIVILMVFVIIMVLLVSRASRSRYRGGFGRRTYFGGRHGGGHCACVRSCACACACACAGGGRAGCSAKNFYGVAVDTEKLKNAINHK